jgi:putative ABC transport system substrate-binding protein
LAAPLTVEAQQPGRVWKIGILTGNSAFHRDGARLFKQRLRDLGYSESSVRFEERFPTSADRLPSAATDLLRSNVDVLVAFTTQPAMAAKAATKTTPIVFAVVSDPVDSGLVATLARPGGNATGLALMQPEISAKQLQLLKDILPGLSRVAVLWNASHPGKRLEFKEIEAAGRVLGVSILSVEVRAADDFRGAFATLAQNPVEALIVLGEPLMSSRQTDILSFVAKRRLPNVGQAREVAEAGGLMSYAPNVSDQFRRAATYVDKILKGTKPADLPVEQPTKFELVINLKTAKALGLTIPQSLLVRADEIIQ